MPSPFPGMDPYLEGKLWFGFHTHLCSVLVEQLDVLLPARYYATSTETEIAVSPDDVATSMRVFQPDVSIKEQTPWSTTGGVTAVLSAPLRLATALTEDSIQRSVEIRDRDRRQLVTAIEILSPTNKIGDGRIKYLRKREKILHSSTHLVEIDLLRRGKRVPMRDPLPNAPYFVFVSRADSRPVLDVWPIALEQALPTIPIPLLPGDADVALPLQHVLTRIYDTRGYAKFIDYAKPPSRPVEPTQEAWLQDRLRSLRQSSPPVS
jgi:hypothetical protein